MKKILMFFILFGASLSSVANHIDESTAKKVGFNFLKARTQINIQGLNMLGLSLAYKSEAKQIFQFANPVVTTYFYIFNINADDGFVIVAGDDIAMPVLGYSTTHKFDTFSIPINILGWFEGYEKAIQYGLDNNILSTSSNTKNWQSLINPTLTTIGATILGTPVLPPLIKTHWDQGEYYNDLCPYDNQQNERTVTGCVATTMAQILKYWNYPATGTSSHNYYHSKYGTLSASFGSTNYQWANMPNIVTSPNYAVAKLMYDCGVSVNMDYNTSSAGGSGAYVISALSPITNCTEYALKNYFGYKSSLRGVERFYYHQGNTWINMMKAELNANRPIIYSGFTLSSGHCFIADGYDNNDFLHINWGWSGYGPDGYYSIDAMDPAVLGIGSGGSGGYNISQDAIIGIEPMNYTQNLTLTLNKSAILSSSTIGYGQQFSVSASIINTGMTNFSGDFAAKVFDTLNNFIADVEIKNNQTLAVGDSTNKLSFSTIGLAAMMPSTYIVGIFYRATGGQWSMVANNIHYTNFPAIEVTNNNPIALFSDINVMPTPIVKGQGININLGIVNLGSTTFYGKYYVGLYKLNGSLVQLLDSALEVNGLVANSRYFTKFITFSNAAVTANVGNYLLMVSYCPLGGTMQLLGSGLFLNPINITVTKSNIAADLFEVNDNVSQATLLSTTYTGSAASANTLGSNCHVGNDKDFYKISLPAGYNYIIKPRLQDVYSQNVGNNYSLDAAFSYSFDTLNWSQVYNDTINGNISINNGGTIYFSVAPRYVGNVGTYLLEMNILRSVVTPVKLIYFSGKLNSSKTITLNWQTATETNVDKFIVEKSVDGLTYNILGSSKAINKNNSLYQFIDEKPIAGINYYRLRMLDNDGKLSYSYVAKVLYNKNNYFNVFPNPTKGILTSIAKK